MKLDRQLWFLAIGFIFFLTFPNGIIISDEYSYLTLGMKISEHLGFVHDYDFKGLDIYYQKYSIGYPFLLSIFSLLGAKVSFLANITMLFLSVGFLSGICKKIGIHSYWAYALMFFMPVVFSSRVLLSEMSALFLVILFLWAFFAEESVRSYFLLGFICFVSFWFREGTIVLLFPLLLYRALTCMRLLMPMVLGLIVGLCPMILQFSFYGVLELRNTGVNFGFDKLLSNLALVLYVGLLVFPLGLVYMYRSKLREKNILIVAMGAYTLMQVLYQYNGLELTGIKALISYPRFYVVLAPFFILFYGSSTISISKRVLYIGSIVVFAVFSGGFYFVDLQYEKIRKLVYSNVQDGTLHSNGTINEISKIIFPERGDLSLGMVENVNVKSLNSNDYILDVKRNDSAIWSDNLAPIKEGTLLDSISIMGFLDYRLLKIQ